MSIWDTNWKIVRSLHFHTSEFWTELKNELNYLDHFDTLVLISKKITLPLFGLEVETVCSNLDNEQDKLEFIKLVQKWIAASCRCHHDRYYGRMFGTDTFCTRRFCMKKIVNNLGFWNKANHYLSDRALEVQCFPEKAFQQGWVQIIPRKEKILLDQVKSKQNLKEKTMTSDIYFNFTHAKDINKMVEVVFSLWKNFCEPKKTVIGLYKTKNFDFANLNRRINAFVRHHSPGETKDHGLGKEWDRMSTIKKKQELKELFYRCILALVLIE